MNYVDRYSETVDRPARTDAPNGAVAIGIVLAVFALIAILWRLS